MGTGGITQNLGEASVDVVVNLDKLEQQLKASRAIFEKATKKMAKSFDKVGKKIAQVGKSLTTKLTAPLLGISVVAGKVTSEFDDSLTKIISLVGQSSDQVAKWREQILLLGPAVGKGPGELADGLFFVTSAGFRGAEAMDTLTQSAKASAAGLGETSVIADAATSAINAFGKENLSAGKAIGILVGTVRDGKLEAAALAASLGDVIPIAAELGVSFDQVGAAIAAMTQLSGNATKAVTGLRGVLNAILKPQPAAIKGFKDMGFSIESVRDTLKKPDGLIRVLTELKAATESTSVELVSIFPDIEGLAAVLSLVGRNAEKTREIFANLRKDGVQTLDKAFNDVSTSSGFLFRQMMSQITASMIRLGDVLLPVVLPLVRKFTTALGEAATAFSKLDARTKAWIVVLTGVAIAAGPVLVSIGLMTVGIGILISGLGILGGVAIGAFAKFVGAIKIAASAVGIFVATAATIPGAIVIALVAGSAAFRVFQKTITGIAKGTIDALEKNFVGGFNNLVVRPFKKLLGDLLSQLPDSVRKALGVAGGIKVPDLIDTTFVDDMAGVLSEAFESGKEEAEDFANGVKDIFTSLWENVTGLIPDNILGLGGEDGFLKEAEDSFEKLMALFNKVESTGTKAGFSIQKAFEVASASASASIKESVEEMIVNMRSLGDIVTAIATIIRQELIRAFIAKNVAGFVGDLFSSGTVPGKKAGGGDVQPNIPVLVGERGPELIVPKVASTVVNAADTRSMGGGKVVNITQNITFTADVKNSVRSEIINAAPVLANMASAQVFDQMQRAGNGN